MVLAHRMTTSWMCCSCWWLWCLNILVPWSRLLTSAMAFGKHGCWMSLPECVVFFPRFTGIIWHFSDSYLCNDTNNTSRTVCSYVFGACMLFVVYKAIYFPIYAMFNLFFQCNFQAFGFKKWRNTSAGAESNGIFSETHASEVSKVRNLKSRVLNCKHIQTVLMLKCCL